MKLINKILTEIFVGDYEEPPRARAADFLQSALDALQQRGVVRDSQEGERSAGRASRIMTAWTGQEWTEDDVWRCLMAVKLARESQGLFHADDLVDLCGYSGLLAEYRANNELEPR